MGTHKVIEEGGRERKKEMGAHKKIKERWRKRERNTQRERKDT